MRALAVAQSEITVRHSNEIIISWWFASHFGDLVVHCQHRAGNQYSTAHALSYHTAGPSEWDAANSVLRNHVPQDRKIIIKLSNNNLHLEKLPTFPSTWSRTGNSWVVLLSAEVKFYSLARATKSMFLLLSCLTSVVLYPCSRRACAFSLEKAISHAWVESLLWSSGTAICAPSDVYSIPLPVRCGSQA